MKAMNNAQAKNTHGGRIVYTCNKCHAMFGQTADLYWHLFWRHFGKGGYSTKNI